MVPPAAVSRIVQTGFDKSDGVEAVNQSCVTSSHSKRLTVSHCVVLSVRWKSQNVETTSRTRLLTWLVWTVDFYGCERWTLKSADEANRCTWNESFQTTTACLMDRKEIKSLSTKETWSRISSIRRKKRKLSYMRKERNYVDKEIIQGTTFGSAKMDTILATKWAGLKAALAAINWRQNKLVDDRPRSSRPSDHGWFKARQQWQHTSIGVRMLGVDYTATYFELWKNNNNLN